MDSQASLPLKDLMMMDHTTLVDLSYRTDGQGLAMAQLMFEHGMDKETAITAMEVMCGAPVQGVGCIDLIEWIVKSYELKLEDVCPDWTGGGFDDYFACIIAACRHGNTDLVIKLNELFDIPGQKPQFRLTIGLQMIMELELFYRCSNSLKDQQKQGYPMIRWVISSLDLADLLPKDNRKLCDLMYKVSGTEPGLNARVNDICQILNHVRLI